jgi:hypothetical protein
LFLPSPSLDRSIASLSATVITQAGETPDAWLALLLGDWAALLALLSVGL